MSKASKKVFLLIGEDTFRREGEIQTLRKKFFGEEEVELHHFDVSEEETSVALEELTSASLFESHKMVVLNHVDQGKKQDNTLLQEFLQRGSCDDLLLLFAADEKKVSTLIKKNLESTNIIKLRKTSAGQIRRWIEEKCAKHKVRFQPKALDYFIACYQEDTESLRRELDKILLWAEEGQEVTLEDCRRLILNISEEKIWNLTDAVAEKNAENALKVLHQLLNQGEEPIRIAISLSRTFDSLLHSKAMADEKVSWSEMLTRIRLPEFLLKKNLQYSKRFTLSTIRQGIALIRQADHDLKGGKGKDADRPMIVERLMLDLCRL